MYVKFSEKKRKLYEKLHFSHQDIRLALRCCEVILANKWHAMPWDVHPDNHVYQQSFTTTLVVSYGRIFTESRNWSPIPLEIVSKIYSAEEIDLHNRLIDLRHTVYAHTDASKHSIKPWISGAFSSAVVQTQAMKLSVDEATLFTSMGNKLAAELFSRMTKIVPPPSAGAPTSP
jgi:hypothetical protein